MTSSNLTSRDMMKQQARRLRTSMAGRGVALTLAQALETIAHIHGYRDWNTAAAVEQGAGLHVGQTVTGDYMGRPFQGTVLGLSDLPHKRQRVTVK